MDIDKLKNAVVGEIDSRYAELGKLSKKLHDNPEIAFEEERSSALLVDFLEKNDFTVEKVPDTQLAFQVGPDGAVAGMTTITPSGDFCYQRVESVSPSLEVLAEYAGRYHSPELDITWTLEAGDDHLVARRRKYVDSRLAPLFQDAFSDDWTPPRRRSINP